MTHYYTFVPRAAKCSGLSEGERGSAPLPAGNSPAGPPFEKDSLHPAETFFCDGCDDCDGFFDTGPVPFLIVTTVTIVTSSVPPCSA